MWRKGAGKRSLECGEKLPESDVWIVEGGCRKARLGERNDVGKRGLGSRRVPECEI